MQASFCLEFCFEEILYLLQLAEVGFTLHQGQVPFNIIEYIGDAASIEGTEVQIEWKFRLLRHSELPLLKRLIIPERG